MGNQQQLRRDYNISEQIICKSGTNNIWDVYSGVHKETKQHVSIWICNTRQLKLKYKSDYTDFENRLKQETIFLSEFGANDVINNKYFLNIKKQFSNRNETIYITEPISGNMTRLKKELFTPLELQLKFSYLRESLDKLHKLHGMVHNNVTKENIIVSASSLGTGHSSQKFFKLHGFYFFHKKGNPLNITYRKRVKKRFKPSCLTAKSKDAVNSERFDLHCLRNIEREFFSEEQYRKNEKKIILLKQIIREKDKYESVKFMNDFLSDLNKENFEMDTFLNYIKDFLLLRIQKYEENKQIMDKLIHALMKYVPRMSDKQFSLLIFPKFKNALKYFQPRPIPLALIKYLEQLLKFCSREEKRQFVYPFIETCLDQGDSSEVLIEILRKSEMCVNRKLIDKKYYVDKILPKIIHLIRFTSFPFVKLNSIVCIGKIIHFIKKDAIVEKILPILKYSIRNEKSTLCLMTIVRVYNRVSKNLDIKTIAHQVLPNIIPASTYAKFDKDKFVEYFKVIQDMVSRIERERMKNFEEMGRLQSAPPSYTNNTEEGGTMPRHHESGRGRPLPPTSGRPGQPNNITNTNTAGRGIFDDGEDDGFFDSPDPSRISEFIPNSNSIETKNKRPEVSNLYEEEIESESFEIDTNFLHENAKLHNHNGMGMGINLPDPINKRSMGRPPTPPKKNKNKKSIAGSLGTSDFEFISSKKTKTNKNKTSSSRNKKNKNNDFGKRPGVVGRDPKYDKNKLNLNLLDEDEDLFKMDEVLDMTSSKPKIRKKKKLKKKKLSSHTVGRGPTPKTPAAVKNPVGMNVFSKPSDKQLHSEFFSKIEDPVASLDEALDNMDLDSIATPSTSVKNSPSPSWDTKPSQTNKKNPVNKNPVETKTRKEPTYSSVTPTASMEKRETEKKAREIINHPKNEEEELVSNMVKGIFGGYQAPVMPTKDEETLRWERERAAAEEHKNSMFDELMGNLDSNPLASAGSPSNSLSKPGFYPDEMKKKDEEDPWNSTAGGSYSMDPIKMMSADDGDGWMSSKKKDEGDAEEEDDFEKLMMQHLDE